jgi:hypothetical protein
MDEFHYNSYAQKVIFGISSPLRSVWVQARPDVPDDLVAEARRVFLDNRDKVWMTAVEEPKSWR